MVSPSISPPTPFTYGDPRSAQRDVQSTGQTWQSLDSQQTNPCDLPAKRKRGVKKNEIPNCKRSGKIHESTIYLFITRIRDAAKRGVLRPAGRPDREDPLETWEERESGVFGAGSGSPATRD